MVTLIRLLFVLGSRLPLPLLHGAGVILGWLSFLLSPRYRRRLLANARQAGMPPGVAWRSVAEAGKLVAELPRLWLGAPAPVRWDGAEHIEAASAAGRGLLFLTPHLGCFEITAQAYAARFGASRPMTVLFRPARQPWLRALVDHSRERPGLRTAPTTLSGVRQLVQALKSGEAVGLLPDQVPPKGLGTWAPFFGREAYTMTLSARLARSGDTQVLLSWGERLPWGQGYVVHVRPLAEPLPADPQAAAAAVNAAMESLVRESPAQYLWSYDRYKPPR
ncbi:MAG: lysophospholipid acyltransferase family protein [Comamonadaceae bacterium]|uniref:Lysophospholipid acyltransferase family protein n=1 Tax=Hydrogenophaga borbori TaxID=2294117 RepID=A0A372ELU6_9BURK|nr:lysophospholipid acyltransferase family protein [Hydrogenophaga sp. SNF1]NCT96828.1 lysophospholipid acyltransferase family protein [Comamonadaceae bacterium]RFP80360.1 lysophospholipid acyltransferase family protein [Hydrogenophaga borbori]WQB84551.1 lysophospholipid acyltransferase family protein [Hydrogenophaga sp. SNF1]